MILNPFRRSSESSSDADLRSYAAHGDAEAFRRLVERHLPTVQEAAARVLGPGSGWVDDVAQDVFLQLARKAPQLPADTVVCAWLHRQAVRRAIDIVRAEDRRRKREAAVDLIAPEAAEGDSVWGAIAPRLDQELLRLPRQDQEVLALRFMERCSSEEAARRLGLSSVAVRKRVERALSKLRERLADPLPSTGAGAGALSVTALAAYLSVPTAKAAPAAKVAAISAHCLAAPAAPALSLSTFTLMTKSQIYTTSAIVAIGASAFFAGRSNGIASAQAEAAATGSQATLELADNAKAPRGNTGRRSGGNDSFPSTKEGRMTMLRMILGNGDAVHRNQSLERFMARLEADELGEMVDFLCQQRPKSAAEEQALASAQQLMLSAWAKRDPMGAIEAAMDPKRRYSGTMPRESQLQTIASVWGAQDPDAAIAWAKARPGYPGTEDKDDPFMVGLVRSVAGQDRSKATALLAEMPFGMTRRAALTGMLPELIGKGQEAAAEWIDGLQDEKLKKGANNMVAEELAETNPKGAAEWILSRMGADTEFSSIDGVMERWMRQQQGDAMAFFESIPAGKVRSDAFRTIMGHLSRSPSEENAEWITSRLGSEPLSFQATTWIFGYWMKKDQGAAIAHFKWMPEERAQMASASILAQLAEHNVQEAANFYLANLSRMSGRSPTPVFLQMESGEAAAFMDSIAQAHGGLEEEDGYGRAALEAWASTNPEDARAYCEERGLPVPRTTQRFAHSKKPMAQAVPAE